MHYSNDKKFILVYKRDKNNNYLLDSAEVVYSSENGEFISQTGKLKGKNIITEVPQFISSESNLLLVSCKAVLYSNSIPISRDECEYVYYEIPQKILNLLEDKTNNHAIIVQMGIATTFVPKGGNLFSVTHTSAIKFNAEIEELKKKSGRADIMDFLSNEDNEHYKEKLILPNLNIQKMGIHQDERTYPEHSQTPLYDQKKGIDVNKIISDIKGKIIGQDEAIESVVANIYANQRIIETRNRDLIATQKASILLDGPTGTGKTAILKEVADKLSLPIVVTSATSYSTTGYVGDTITDILGKLIEMADGNLELAQRGIVCIDEIDKLGGFSKEKEIVMRKGVQQELLAFISGGKYDVKLGGFMGKKVEFDTSNLTFICMGAFTDIRDQKIEEKNKNSKPMGFAVSEINEETDEDKTYNISEQDYIEYGLEREFVGRFALLTSTKAYSKKDYKNILLKSTISPLKTFIEFAKSFGVEEVNYDDAFIDEVCNMAYELNFGARGLHQIISNLKNVLLLDIINGQSKTIILTNEMLNKVKEKSIRTY